MRGLKRHLAVVAALSLGIVGLSGLVGATAAGATNQEPAASGTAASGQAAAPSSLAGPTGSVRPQDPAPGSPVSPTPNPGPRYPGAPGTTNPWQALKNEPSFATGQMIQLTDGSVMVQNLQSPGQWWKLTPDTTGSYVNGTWTQLASMPSGYAPLDFSSAVLPDGRVLMEGGEYNFTGTGETSETAIGAIYDPVANTWASVNPPSGWTEIGDSPSAMLANGQFIIGQNESTADAVFNPTTLTWQVLAGTGKADCNAEEGWSLLPNTNLLTVDTYDCTNSSAGQNTEKYNPSSQTWSSAGSTPSVLGNPPPCSQNICYVPEVGAQLLRPNGTVFAAGGTAANAVYNTATGTWSAGPNWPVINSQQYDQMDGPAAILPDGDILLAASPGWDSSPLHFFDFNGTTLTQVADWPDPNSSATSQFTRMLDLPTGQVLAGDENQAGAMYVYTDANPPQSSWAPTVTSTPKSLSDGQTYTISGTQLNGLTQGTAFGDDSQNATNYPLVRITNTATGDVLYARTANMTSMSVAPGTSSSAQFTLPDDAETGASTLSVVANGIASTPVSVTVNSKPIVTSAVFGGNLFDPTITVSGENFGSEPTGAAPSCGKTGLDFGNVEFADTTGGWGAGKTGDCIGLVVDSWNNNQIVFGFGSDYVYNPLDPAASLNPGNSFSMSVAGSTVTGTVGYATVSRVTVSGTQTSPQITVVGSNFGYQQPGTPASCSASGLVFGESLFLVDNTKSWNAGEMTYAGASDCVGLTVTQWSPTEISFGFGNYYGQAGITLAPGDSYSLFVLSPTPPAAAGTASYSSITNVAFTGTEANPTVTVTGTNLGSEPAGVAAGCSGTGDDFTGVLFEDVTSGWNAGSPGNCIGLVVTSWTNTQIVFGFGSVLTDGSFSMANGDQFQLNLFGATANGTAGFPQGADVVFTGTATDPTVTITGTNLGTEPAGTPAGCGATGLNFGTSLYIADLTNGWTAGEKSGSIDNCIGLLVSSWTSTKIVFQFGSYLSGFSTLAAGDRYQLNLLGTQSSGTVAYPSISGVKFSGTAAAPTVTVSGSGFGTTAPPGVAAACSTTGLDYGSLLSFLDTTANWGAGRGNPGDCIGLVVTSYSPTQIVFGFGSGYSGLGFSLNNGNHYALNVLGASFTSTAHYPRLKATGSVAGTLDGTIHFSSALTTTPSSGVVTETLSGTLSGLTGSTSQLGGIIAGASVRMTVTLPAGSTCATVLNGPSFPDGKVSVTYSSTGVYFAPSTITFLTSGIVNTPPLTATLSGATVTGSFTTPSGASSKATLVFDQTKAALGTECGKAGLKGMGFKGVKGASSLTLG